MRRTLLMLGLLAGCNDTEAVTAGSTDRPVVYTTMYPVTWLTERLAGGALDVVCPVPEDADAIFWEPPRDVLAAYRAADLVVANGAGFAQWLERASLPESRLVRAADGLTSELLHFEETTHSHGPAGDHTHAGIDGHTWVDPVNAKEQARAIAAALSLRFADELPELEADLARLESDLDRLLEAWRELVPRLREVRLLCSHPAYDYLWRRLGLTATNLDLDPEALFTERARAAVTAALASDRRNVLIWESAPLPATRTALAAELDVVSVTVSPVEVLPAAARAAGNDYLSIQLVQIARLGAALE